MGAEAEGLRGRSGGVTAGALVVGVLLGGGLSWGVQQVVEADGPGSAAVPAVVSEQAEPDLGTPGKVRQIDVVLNLEGESDRRLSGEALARVEARLRPVWPEVKVDEAYAPVDGVVEALVGDEVLYMLEDRDVAFVGRLLDLASGRDVTALREAKQAAREQIRLAMEPGTSPFSVRIGAGSARERLARAAGFGERAKDKGDEQAVAALLEQQRAASAQRIAEFRDMSERMLTQLREDTGLDRAPRQSSGGGAAQPQQREVGGHWYVISGESGERIPKVGYDSEGRPVSAEVKAERARDMLARVPDEWSVSYPATSEERAEIVVFTDYTCPYCKRLHDSLPQLQQAGVTVRYLMYPRSLARPDSARAQEQVEQFSNAWCAEDQQAAMDSLFARRQAPDADCDAIEGRMEPPVYDHYTLGNLFGVPGTPMIVTSEGEMLVGFGSAGKLLRELGVE